MARGASVTLLAAPILWACAAPTTSAPASTAAAPVGPDDAILSQIADLTVGESLVVADRRVTVLSSYVAASGSVCKTIRIEGAAADSRFRLACAAEGRAYFSPDIFGERESDG